MFDLEDSEICGAFLFYIIMEEIKTKICGACKKEKEFKDFYREQSKKWSVTIKKKYIGLFTSEKEASEAVMKYLNLTEKLLRK